MSDGDGNDFRLGHLGADIMNGGQGDDFMEGGFGANLGALTTKMLEDYKTNVYNNTAVNTTSKQQVMGLEFNFNAMMLLVKQNNRLMQLIATSR